MKMISKAEGGKGLNKQKTDLQLPKINKNPLLEGASYQGKYQWVNRSSEYVLLSNHTVQQQQAYLLQELSALQDQLSRLNQPGDSRVSKPLRKSHQTNIMQNRQRQIENNSALIWKLRSELQLLLRQAGANSKQNIEVALIQTREKITKTKQKIKEIKQKSRQMEGSFQNGHDIYEEMEKLQHQRNGFESKRQKIQQKMAISINNLERLEGKLVQIQQEFTNAQRYLEEHYSSEKTQAQGKQMQGVHRQKMYQMQVTRKMIESQRSVKQQKCHQLLKTLETQVQKLDLLEKKFQSLQMRNLYQKKQIIQLEDQLLVQEQTAREQARTSGSLQPRFHKKDASSQANDYKTQKLKMELGQVKNLRLRPQMEKDNESRILYSSRTKTSADYKINRTEMMVKPPSSEHQSDMTRMISQALPVNRAYFRTSKTRNLPHSESSESNFKAAAFAQIRPKEAAIHVQQQIVEQSPEKETIDKPPVQFKPKSEQIELKPQKQESVNLETESFQNNNLISAEAKIEVQQNEFKIEQNNFKAEQKIIDMTQRQAAAETKHQQTNPKISTLQQQMPKDSQPATEDLVMKQKKNIIENYLNKFDQQGDDEGQDK